MPRVLKTIFNWLLTNQNTLQSQSMKKRVWFLYFLDDFEHLPRAFSYEKVEIL